MYVTNYVFCFFLKDDAYNDVILVVGGKTHKTNKLEGSDGAQCRVNDRL